MEPDLNVAESAKPVRTVCFFSSHEEHKAVLEKAKRLTLDYYLQDGYSDWVMVTE